MKEWGVIARDDCKSIRTGCSNLEIRNVACRPGHGISIGGLGAGGSKACISDVIFWDVQLIETLTGARIKTWQVRLIYSLILSLFLTLLFDHSLTLTLLFYFSPVLYLSLLMSYPITLSYSLLYHSPLVSPLPFHFSPPPFLPFADVSLTWPSSTSATAMTQTLCDVANMWTLTMPDQCAG